MAGVSEAHNLLEALALPGDSLPPGLPPGGQPHPRVNLLEHPSFGIHPNLPLPLTLLAPLCPGDQGLKDGPLLVAEAAEDARVPLPPLGNKTLYEGLGVKRPITPAVQGLGSGGEGGSPYSLRMIAPW